MSHKIPFFFSVLLPLFFIGVPSIAGAQYDVVFFSTTPKMPGANEEVVLRMESYAVNINTANITWYVNKEPIKNGIAETSITLRTGDFGTKTVVDVLIVTAEGMTMKKEYVIAPAEVDMLWEAQTYTPPFYKGKALPSYKSLVRVTAIPRYNTLESDPKQYSYKWTYNRTLGAGEGLGKNSVVLPVGYAGVPVPINVDVSLPGTDWKGSQYYSIPVFDTSVVFYEQAPLLGVQYHRALSPWSNTKGVEYTVHAVPYNFSSDDLLNGVLTYQWSVNKQVRATGADPLNMTLVRAEKGGESQYVSLDIANPRRILQEGSRQTTVIFSAEE